VVNAGRGVAYALWREVESRRLEQGLTKAELAERAKLARTTINDLQSGTAVPRVKTVHALADLLHIDRREAEILAGLRPAESEPSQEVDVRAAIQTSTAYTEEQRAMLLAMIDTIERANGLAGNSGEPPQMRVV
jgi:transcriptional regulator with XRE-family HTH domain